MHWLHPVSLITSLALWVLYACWEGRREAQFYYLLWCPELNEKKNGVEWLKRKNLHPFFTVQRSFVYLLVVAIKCFDLIYQNEQYAWWELLVLVSASFLTPVFIFPFFHDGSYYKEYNKLSNKNYPEGWWSESVTSKAILEFGKYQRIALLFISFMLVVLEVLMITLNLCNGN
jgi:hypothetical protein